MKHKIALLISVGLVAAGTISAVNTHRQYIHQLTIQNALNAANQARQAAIQKAEEQAKAAQIEDTLTRLQKACSDGLAAYHQLTDTQQKRIEEPTCNIQ